MTTVTLDMPDKLAKEVASFGRWLPTVLEISLLKLKTPATKTAAEIVDFLASKPSVKALYNYHVSDKAQAHMTRLLELNQAGCISKDEVQELDELVKLENIIISLKASLSSDDIAA